MTAGTPNQSGQLGRSQTSGVDNASRAEIDAIAESFVGRLRAGERPSIDDYIDRFPQVADEIRDLFPTLEMLERCAPAEEDAADSSSSLRDESPRTLGEYRIIREVGRGGMGVVYEAEHATLRRRVALKVLANRALANTSYLERFHREARAAGRLHHTNIVPVFEVGADDGLNYYTMQFIQGQNLDVVLEELRRLKHLKEGGDARTLRHPLTVRQRLSQTVARNLLSGEFQKARPFLDGLLEFDRTTRLAGESTNDDGALTTQTTAGAAGENGGSPSNVAAPNLAVPNILPPGVALSAEPEKLTDSKASFSDSSHSTAILRGLPNVAQLGPHGETYCQRVARVGMQAADALAYAHGQGVLHRDIKPSNLILDSDGVVWIADFGLAKDDDEDFTNSGDIVGTLRYMAPERFQGHSEARSDIYGLGLSLYEMLTLQYAYDASDKAALVRMISDEEPRKPRDYDPEIPRDLETIVLKAIHKSPSHRYVSARDMADDLHAFLANRPIKARRITALEKAWMWCRRNPLQAVLASCVAVLLTILFVGALVFGFLSNRQAEDLARANATAELRLYDSLLGRAQAGLGSGRPGQYFTSWEAIAGAAELIPKFDISAEEAQARRLELRNEAIATMAQIDMQPAKTWKLGPGETSAIAFDADYQRIAQSNLRGDISIRRVADNSQIKTFKGPGEQAWYLDFSPDGRFLYGKFHRSAPEETPPVAIVWDVDRGEKIVDFRERVGVGAMSFSADSNVVAVGRSDAVELYSLPQGELLERWTDIRDPIDVEFSPVTGSRRLALGINGANRIEIWETAEDPPRRVQSIELDGEASVIAWRDDGARLASGNKSGGVKTWNVTGEPLLATAIRAHTSRVVRIKYTHRGDLLLTDSWDGTSKLWNADTGERALRMDGVDFPKSGFSRDDGKLGFNRVNVEYGILELAANPPWRMLLDEHWSSHHHFAFHPQVPWLLASATEEALTLWDVRSGDKLLSRAGSDLLDVGFSSQGEQLFITRTAGIARAAFSIDAESRHIEIGAEEIVSDLERGRVQFLPDGSRHELATSDYLTAQVRTPERQSLTTFEPHPNVRFAKLSPDGTLFVTSTWQGEGIKLWDATTGDLLRDLAPGESTADTAFSLDGGMLAATTGFRQFVWTVGDWDNPTTWQRTNPDGWAGGAAFSPDGKIVAMPWSRFKTAFYEAASGRVLAIFDSPWRETGHDLRFSPDGQYFIISGEHAIHVWDVETVRARLAELGLDWRSP